MHPDPHLQWVGFTRNWKKTKPERKRKQNKTATGSVDLVLVPRPSKNPGGRKREKERGKIRIWGNIWRSHNLSTAYVASPFMFPHHWNSTALNSLVFSGGGRRVHKQASYKGVRACACTCACACVCVCVFTAPRIPSSMLHGTATHAQVNCRQPSCTFSPAPWSLWKHCALSTADGHWYTSDQLFSLLHYHQSETKHTCPQTQTYLLFTLHKNLPYKAISRNKYRWK